MGKKIAYGAVLAALAMIFSYVEAMLAIPVFVPGVKLGIANLVVVTGLYYMRPGEVLLISFVRIALSSLLFGSGLTFLYSFAGGLLSFLVMLAVKRIPGFSVVGVSIAGGVAHNVGQMAIAVFLVKNSAILYYIPALLIAGVVTGMVMGFLSMRVLPVLRRLNRRN